MTAVVEPAVDAEDIGAAIEGFAMRLLGAAIGMLDLVTIRLGIDLGLYAALASDGPLTCAAVAQRAGTDERYTQEWLEQQAVTGILTVSDDAGEQRFAMPPAHAEVLVNRDSPAYLGALGLISETATILPSLLQAFRDGTGVDWAQYGDEPRLMQAELNRPGYLTQLAQEWMPAMPDIEARLRNGNARVADVCCGVGWSSIAFALAYPDVEVCGFDSDDASIADARRHAADAGVADRVHFEVRDAAEPGLPEGSFDLVIGFEFLHDLAQPVEALTAMRRLATPDGFVVVVDNAVPEEFSAPGTEIDRLLYGTSVLVCLPTGRAHEHSAATGAVMRPSTFERYARDAGFTTVDIADVPHPFSRFYRLG